MSARLLLIDNYDSFTYNLVQAFLILEAEVVVHRNDAIDLAAADSIAPTHLVISPGPGRPTDAGATNCRLAASYQQIRGRIPAHRICRPGIAEKMDATDRCKRLLLWSPEIRGKNRINLHRQGGQRLRLSLRMWLEITTR